MVVVISIHMAATEEVGSVVAVLARAATAAVVVARVVVVGVGVMTAAAVATAAAAAATAAGCTAPYSSPQRWRASKCFPRRC